MQAEWVQGYMAGKNCLSRGKNYLLKSISLQVFAFTVHQQRPIHCLSMLSAPFNTVGSF